MAQSKKVLFFIRDENTFGLYESFINELKNENIDVELIDISSFYKNVDKKKTTYSELEYYKKLTCNHCSDYEKFDIIASYIRRSKSSLVVVPYELGYFYYIVQASKFLGIKTLHIQHGVWGKGKFLKDYNRSSETIFSIKDLLKNKLRLVIRGIKYFIKKDRRLFYRYIFMKQRVEYMKGLFFPLCSDYIVVPSQYYKQQVIDEAKKFPIKNILVPGYLRGDILSSQNQDIRKSFGIPSEKKIVSYFYSAFYLFPERFEEKYSSLKAMIEVLKYLEFEGDYFYLILIHPGSVSESTRIEKELVKANIEDFLITTSQNLQGSIYKQSKLVIGAKSGALTEASSFTNVIRQNYVLEGIHEEFQKEISRIHFVNQPSEIESVLNRIKFDDDILNNDVLEINGDAGRRLIIVLREKGIL